MPWISDRRWQAVEERLEAIHYELVRLRKLNERMMTMFDDLKTEVTAIRGTADSAIALLDGLSKKLDEAIASGDPAQVKALADELKAEREALADAVARNTRA